MAAQQQGAPMDPAMAQGGMPPMPMDPSMLQGMPMDPSMMVALQLIRLWRRVVVCRLCQWIRIWQRKGECRPQGAGMPPQQGAGMPPQQGAQQPIQIVPGPVDPSTGQPIPIDAETGMIVLDPANGVEWI